MMGIVTVAMQWTQTLSARKLMMKIFSMGVPVQMQYCILSRMILSWDDMVCCLSNQRRGCLLVFAA